MCLRIQLDVSVNQAFRAKREFLWPVLSPESAWCWCSVFSAKVKYALKEATGRYSSMAKRGDLLGSGCCTRNVLALKARV